MIDPLKVIGLASVYGVRLYKVCFACIAQLARAADL